MAWIVPEKGLAVSWQCELAGVCRATAYAQRKPQVSAQELTAYAYGHLALHVGDRSRSRSRCIVPGPGECLAKHEGENQHTKGREGDEHQCARVERLE